MPRKNKHRIPSKNTTIPFLFNRQKAVADVKATRERLRKEILKERSKQQQTQQQAQPQQQTQQQQQPQQKQNQQQAQQREQRPQQRPQQQAQQQPQQPQANFAERVLGRPLPTRAQLGRMTSDQRIYLKNSLFELQRYNAITVMQIFAIFKKSMEEVKKAEQDLEEVVECMNAIQEGLYLFSYQY